MLNNLNIPNPFEKKTSGAPQEQQKVPPRTPDTESFLEKQNRQGPDNTEQKPVDKWANLYDTTEDDEKKDNADKKDQIDFSMAGVGYSRENVAELSKKLPISMPDDEEIKEIMSSQDPARFKEMMGTMMRDVFKMSVIATQQGADQVFSRTGEYVSKNAEKAAEAKILRSVVAETLTEEFPDHYKNPSFRSTVEDVRDRMLRKYPDATPREISGMLKDFIQDSYGITPRSKQVEEQRNAPQEENWLDI